jgi:flagellar FliJ protein
MKNTFRLKVVQELAQKKSDDAAERLGLLNGESAKAEQKLAMLLDYREDYHEKFRTAMRADLNTANLRNFHDFLGKLDEAIEQQRAACERAREAVAAGRRDWQVKRIDVKAYDRLEERHQAAQLERVKKLEQRATDEFAARSHFHKG